LIVARIAVALIFRFVGIVPWDHQRFSVQDSVGPAFALLIELPLVAAIVVVTIGLWQFRLWARTAYVIVLAASVLVGLMFPPSEAFPRSPLVAAFAYLEIFAQGVVVTMAFLPPVSQRFEHRKV
jgi:hypothetical protein